jgi:energy-coupling factor transporter ATP-binding protein EcfA2
MEKISKETAWTFDDNEVISFLKKQWEMPKDELIRVVGLLKLISYGENNFYRLVNVKNHNKTILDYPLTNLEDKESIEVKGIHVNSNLYNELEAKYSSKTIFCNLMLSILSEREKHDNPFLLTVDTESIKIVSQISQVDVINGQISQVDVINDTDGNILIEDTVINNFVNKNSQDIQIKINDQQQIYNELCLKYEEQEKTFDNLQSKKHEIEQYVKEQNTLLKSLSSESEHEKQQLKLIQEKRMKKTQEISDYIKNKADSLLKLEFINRDQYEKILETDTQQDELTEEFLDFNTDFNADYSLAVSHIQAYLYEKGIFYPKYLLEDYFSLIQTNDLIILAGDSGSGKTNLVKSFADAVGGVSKIIPVKPSWTSSEDLQGYYNPLQKTYLSTPFLEALIEATQNPDIPYFICLDEMNLARVEYYFAEFLSKLEERENYPEIELYSDEESSHVLNEFNNVLKTIDELKERYNKSNIDCFYDILSDNQINQELKTILGLSDKVSLISYHSSLRRMLGGIIRTPSSMQFPANVRIIGAINIDETTHYLSPKVLDRAHVIKFDNLLLTDWKAIEEEVSQNKSEKPNLKIKFEMECFGTREPYPQFYKDDEFCQNVIELTKMFFKPLGVEIGLRTIRQGLNYEKYFRNFNKNEHIAFNNFILHKILPKFTFDGNTEVKIEQKTEQKLDIVKNFKHQLKTLINQEINQNNGRDAIKEVDEMVQKSEGNDRIINYWA